MKIERKNIMGRRKRQQPKIKIVYRDPKGKKKWTDEVELELGTGVKRIMVYCHQWRKDNPDCKFIAVEVGPGIRR
jgi:hypothetical protein